MKHSIVHKFAVPAAVFLVGAMGLMSCQKQPAGGADSARRPNILFLLTDNQRWNMMGGAGNPIIQTPNMDKLAAAGVRFGRSFVTTPICAAGRASILTGLYRRRHQFTFLEPPLRSEFTDISYPRMLRDAGYRTGYIGKFGIESHGKLLLEKEQQTLKKMFDHFDNFEHWGVSGPDGYFARQPDGSLKHLTNITGTKAIEFLRAYGSDQPFCLTVSFNAPHAQDNDPRQYIWPEELDHLYQAATIPVPPTADPVFFAALPDFIKSSEGRIRWAKRFDTPEKFQRMMKGMYRMVSGVDRSIGRILEEMKRQEIDKNTVIIFMSDNGMLFGERGLSDCWLMYEDSIRVPLVVFDPRAQEGLRGITVEQMALNIDIAPTILELAGLEPPVQMQGRSLVPLLRGESPDWRKDFLFEHFFQTPEIRIPPSEGVRTERWKYIRYLEQQPVHEELYDLHNDKLETRNLADEPRFAKQLNELRKRCDQLIDQVKARKKLRLF